VAIRISRKPGRPCDSKIVFSGFFLIGKVPKDLENSFQRWIKTYKEDPKKKGKYNQVLD
jgi:hypothetical protein